MTDDPDAMWQPGFEPDDAAEADATEADVAEADAAPSATAEIDPATADHIEIVLDEPTLDSPPATNQITRSRWHRWRAPVTAAAITALALGAFVLIQGGAETERPEAEPVAGADRRRVAGTADRLWTTTIDLTDGIVGVQLVRLTQFLVADRSTVLAVLPAAGDTSIVVGLDALTGDEQWRRPLDFDATAVSIIAVIADTAILEQNDLDGRRLIGIDVATGTTSWELPTRDNGVHVVLSGTNVVTRVSFTGNARLTFIDPTTGEEVSRVSGRLIGTDLAGTWYVEDGRRISAIDLSDGVAGTTEFAERSDGWSGPTAIVDGRVIVLDDDGTLAEAPTVDGPLVALVAAGGDLPDIVSLVATGGPTVMAIGAGKVLGITLVGDDAEIQWTNDASVRVVNVTDRGMLVSISDATLGFVDGADLAVIDPLTGEQLANSGPAPSTEDLPRILGDGFVITNSGQLGLERVGFDLDGSEMWRLPGNDPIQFGDRVMVIVNAGVSGYAFSGFGDAE